MTGNETNPLIEAKMKPHKSASKIKAIKLALDDSIVNLDANAWAAAGGPDIAAEPFINPVIPPTKTCKPIPGDFLYWNPFNKIIEEKMINIQISMVIVLWSKTFNK